MSATPVPLTIVEFAGPITACAGRFLAMQGHQVLRVASDRTDDDNRVDVAWRAGKVVLVPTPGDPMEGELGATLRSADAALVGEQTGDLPDRLHRRFPQLDVVCLTPWGRTGPHADRPATDHTIAAAGGWMGQIGFPGEAPLCPPGEQAWVLAGVAGALAVQLGALRRERRRVGTMFDVAALEVVAATLEVGALAWLHEGRTVPRPGRRHPLVPHQLLRARDGWIAAGLGGNDSMWERLRDWLAQEGEAGLLAAEFSDATSRLAARPAIFEVLARHCSTRGRIELWNEAQHRRLPWAAVLEPAEVTTSAQLSAREFFRAEKVDDVGDVLTPGLPVRVTVNESAPRPSSAPASATAGIGDAAALDGVRVLDLTWVLAGPFATRLLADHGAEVIKVESIHRPDPTRWSPAMHLGPGPMDDPETSGYFANHNRNKLSISLNLRRPEGLDVLRRLVASVDVIVDNYSAGTLARWGLDRDSLWRIRPDLIIAECSGMGQHGPWSHFVSYADGISALSGLTALTVDRRGEAVGVVFGLGDLVAGYHGALAVAAALRERVHTGRGAYLDLSQLEAVACNLAPLLAHRPDGSLVGPEPSATLDIVVQCANDDRWCAVSLPSDPTERAIRLRRVTIGRHCQGAPDHRRGVTWLTKVALQSPPDELAEALSLVGIAAAVVADGRRLVEREPQLAARRFYLPVAHPVGGSYLVEGDPILVDGRRPPVRQYAPLLGQHTRDVLAGLGGYSADEIDRFASEGITS